jgi:hypothetical protein
MSVFFSPLFYQVVGLPRFTVVENRSDLILPLLHPASHRLDADDTATDITEHPLLIGEAIPDSFTTDEGTESPLPDHKLGGRPFILERRQTLLQSLTKAEELGFAQVLQLDYIVTDETLWSGQWPFADGMFHLLARPPYLATDWAWIWQW